MMNMVEKLKNILHNAGINCTIYLCDEKEMFPLGNTIFIYVKEEDKNRAETVLNVFLNQVESNPCNTEYKMNSCTVILKIDW